MQQILQFISDPQNQFGSETRATLVLAIVPIVLAIGIAIPLGVLVERRPIGAFLAANLSGLVRAIPTLAILVAALTVFNLGIGFKPAALALTVLGIPPILLNTVAGLRGIDPATIDAARGMGMTSWQVLTQVRLPLTLPVIAAGVRTGAVQIVATVPLAALIGGGGYGDYILEGINLLKTPPLIVGSVGIAVLALITELGLAWVQRSVTPVGLRHDDQLASRGQAAGITAPEEAPVAVS